MLVVLSEKMAEPQKLGFDGLVEAGEEEATGYTVNFSSTERESPEAQDVREEITLIDTADSGSRSELTATEKVSLSVRLYAIIYSLKLVNSLLHVRVVS